MVVNEPLGAVKPEGTGKRPGKGISFSLLLIFVILGVGIYARCADLAWHFSNNDDLRGVRRILEGPVKMHPFFAIPETESNAPIQFIYTTLLISPAQSYRELLFWGRLPSCVAGILALFAMVYFYRKWEGRGAPGIFIGLSLLAFSWENIAYAKQTYSYAIGVLALTLLLGFFAEVMKAEKVSWGRVLALSFGSAMLCNMQYQMHIFIPAFYAVLFLHQWTRRKDRAVWTLHFFAGCVLFTALMFPTWYFFLWNKLGMGGMGAADPQLAPVFSEAHVSGKTLWEGARFFVENLFVVFQTKTGFAPEESYLFRAVSILLYALFLLGAWGAAVSRDERKKWLLVFFVLSLGCWWALTAMHKLTFGVTRQTLILLPFFCVFVSEGFCFLTEKIRVFLEDPKLPELTPAAAKGTALVLLAAFLIYFPQFLSERRDLTEEKEILDIFHKFPPDVLIYNGQSFGFAEMKKLKAYTDKLQSEDPGDVHTVAWISRYAPTQKTLDTCDDFREVYNEQARRAGRPQLPFPYPCSEYKIVFSMAKPSRVQTDFSRRHPQEMYSNSLYLYIFERLKPGGETPGA